MSAGNRSVLVVIDSARVASRKTVDVTVCAALDHFGAAWEVFDSANRWEVPEGYFDRALIIIGHDGAGAALSKERATEIKEAVTAGVGLISFDREIFAWPEPLKDLAPTIEDRGSICGLSFPDPCHSLAVGHRSGEEILFLEETVSLRFKKDAHSSVIATDTEEVPIILLREEEKMRTLFFGIGNALYQEEVFGHLRGLDGLFWRGLVQVARKPFPLRSIPPYLSARIDDCHGTHTAFQYVDIFNKHGISPNLGLFIDELGPTDWQGASRLFQKAGADFSAHAFRDDFYKAYSDWKPFGTLADKPDLSEGGKVTCFEGIGLDHETGRDLDDKTVQNNFKRIDEAFSRAKIRHSRIINAHYGEIGLSSLPYFLERNVTFLCNNSLPGQLYGNQKVWRPLPYQQRSTLGRHGFALDRIPHHPAFTMISASGDQLGDRVSIKSEILRDHVPFLGEAPSLQMEKAVKRGITAASIGFDSLAFGMIMTHEERIDVIALQEWEKVVSGIVEGITEYETIPTSREFISMICKRLFDTQLSFANLENSRLTCEITGVADGPSPLTVWNDGPDGPVVSREDVPEVQGFLRVFR
ncbi:MAG: hypothetical protein WDA18_03920 [Candidatus Ratteibacteria bacterium]|jgi:hypothetical protein